MRRLGVAWRWMVEGRKGRSPSPRPSSLPHSVPAPSSNCSSTALKLASFNLTFVKSFF